MTFYLLSAPRAILLRTSLLNHRANSFFVIDHARVLVEETVPEMKPVDCGDIMLNRIIHINGVCKDGSTHSGHVCLWPHACHRSMVHCIEA